MNQWRSRKCFSNVLTRPWHAKANANCAFIAHICGASTRPLRLNIAYFTSNTAVASVNQQGHTCVDYLGDQRIALFVGGVCLNLGQDEGIPVFDYRL